MILVVQGWLPHYRRSLFNALVGLGPITVVHSGAPARQSGDRFEEMILPVTSLGPFRFQRGLVDLIAELRPQAIIAMFDVRWPETFRAMYRFDQQLGWIWWGLAPGRHATALLVKLAIARRPNPIVFYDAATRDQIRAKIRGDERLFVANNTFHVPDRIEAHLNAAKNRFINVGSLDARKQNDVTIRAFSRVIRDIDCDLKLTLIGDGAERGALENLIQSLGLEERVELVGQINDPQELGRYYSEAIASISFGQAGLAVLQSMAYGVPFVTKRNAVSGGEISNITSWVNGVLCDDNPVALEAVMRTLINEPGTARRLGRAAFDYYSSSATIEGMVDSFARAVDFADKTRAARIR